MIDRDDRITLLKSQVQRPRETLPNSESSAEAAPSWMAETLGDSALMRKASKCPETLPECRLGEEKPMGEVSDPDLKRISLDLRNTKWWDVLLSSKSSQSESKCLMVITLWKSIQNDGGAPASKTQLMKCPMLLLIG